MDVTHSTGDAQAARWKAQPDRRGSSAGLARPAHKPFEDLLVEAVCAAHAGQVLDVGCGTGSTTVAVATPRAEWPLHRRRHLGTDDRRRPLAPREKSRRLTSSWPTRRAR